MNKYLSNQMFCVILTTMGTYRPQNLNIHGNVDEEPDVLVERTYLLRLD